MKAKPATETIMKTIDAQNTTCQALRISRQERRKYEKERKTLHFPSQAHMLAWMLCVVYAGETTAPIRAREFLASSGWTPEQMRDAYDGKIHFENMPRGFMDIMGAMRFAADVGKGKTGKGRQAQVARKFQANTLQLYLRVGRNEEEARWLLYYL